MTRNTCVACGKPIGIAFLMCAPHWHLVPRAMQTAVYRTWGNVQRRRGRTPTEQLGVIKAYGEARDAAVNHARERIEEQGEPDGHSGQD